MVNPSDPGDLLSGNNFMAFLISSRVKISSHITLSVFGNCDMVFLLTKVDVS